MFRMKKLNLTKAKVRSASFLPESFRRTTTMFPECRSTIKDVKDTVAVRFHHLVISLEGGQRSGCLKIESPRAKSRSAVLLYRGRVVGCVYGRKNMICKYLAQDAHKCAMSDLASPGNVVEAYELPEEIVLSAASLFCGQPVHLNQAPSPDRVFEQAMGIVVRSGLPGCVVLTSDTNESVCLFYIHNGQVLGVHSAKDGWLSNTKPDFLRQYVRDLGPVRVMGSVLPSQSTEPEQLGFSLSGLGDRPSVNHAQIASINALGESAIVMSADKSRPTPGGPMGASDNSRAHSRSRVKRFNERSTFNITPA